MSKGKSLSDVVMVALVEDDDKQKIKSRSDGVLVFTNKCSQNGVLIFVIKEITPSPRDFCRCTIANATIAPCRWHFSR